MVQFFNLPQDPKARLAEQLGLGLGQGVNQIVQQKYQRGLLQSALGEISQAAQSGKGPLPTILATLSAGAGIPGSERYIGALLPILEKLATTNAAERSPLPLEGQNRTREPLEQMAPRQELPGFLGQPGTTQEAQTEKFFPTAEGPGRGPGQAPQAATRGYKVPILTPEETRSKGRELAAQMTAQGNPTRPDEGAALVAAENEKAKDYNKLVEEERKERVGAQEAYGKIAEEYLKDVYPEASPELATIFQKEGEALSGQGKSQADIKRTLATKAKNLKNSIVNAQKEYSAPRIQAKLWRSLAGEYKNFEQAASDVKRHLQPLLDQGLFDTARKILSDKGYGIEEREGILHPLSNQSYARINQVPKIAIKRELGRAPGIPATGLVREREPVSLEPIKDALKEMKSFEPNFSLTLARKAFEDKGYDWREFKDALNELQDEGFQLEDDQRTQQGYLDSPPLNAIEKVLHGLDIIGR